MFYAICFNLPSQYVHLHYEINDINHNVEHAKLSYFVCVNDLGDKENMRELLIFCYYISKRINLKFQLLLL